MSPSTNLCALVSFNVFAGRFIPWTLLFRNCAASIEPMDVLLMRLYTEFACVCANRKRNVWTTATTINSPVRRHWQEYFVFFFSTTKTWGFAEFRTGTIESNSFAYKTNPFWKNFALAANFSIIRLPSKLYVFFFNFITIHILNLHDCENFLHSPINLDASNYQSRFWRLPFEL